MSLEAQLVSRYAREIDLPAYLQQSGFAFVATAKDGSSIQMHHSQNQRVLTLTKDAREGWTYANPDDPNDRGTIGDFLKRHEGLVPGQVLNRLGACLDSSRRDVPEAVNYRFHLAHKPEVLTRAETAHAVAIQRRGEALNSLERSGLNSSAIPEWRHGPIRSDDDVARLRSDPAGDLWASRNKPTDKRVVIAERPMDALACGQLRGDKDACFLAVGSRLDPQQKRRLAHVLAEVPPGVAIILAFGRDETGRRLAEEVRALAPLVKMERAAPEFGARWSDDMQLQHRHARSLTRVQPELGR